MRFLIDVSGREFPRAQASGDAKHPDQRFMSSLWLLRRTRIGYFAVHLDELGLDVTEAQVRIFRREKKKVTTLVWDLYGRRDEPRLE